MAFTNFYLIAGGTGSADINAGSSIGAAQAAPATGGSWTNATNTYVAPSGTPFATTVPGDYVSVYADGATVTGYVAKVTTVVSNVSVILDGTIKYGTAPTDSANARSAVAGGSWNTEQVLAAGGLATTTVPQSTKVNIKGNLTIAASRTVSMAGTTTAPVWFSGYNATPGDLDADTTNALAKPIWTLNATFALTLSGAYQIVSGLSIVGSRSGTILALTGAQGQILRVRAENTSANTAAGAVNLNAANLFVAYCWFKCPTTAATAGVATVTTSAFAFGTVVEGSGKAGFDVAATFIGTECVCLNNTGSGVLSATSAVRLDRCTIYNSTSDAIKWTGTPPAGSHVVGTLVNIAGGYGINNASGANTANVFRACNDFYACTSNPENGFGDSPAFFQQTDSAAVVTSATDMTPVAGSNARAHGYPGIFENGAFSSYVDIGAVQHQDTPPTVIVTNTMQAPARKVVSY